MNLIEKLDNLKHLADTTDTGEDEQRATTETFDLVWALQDAYPKLRAVVIAARYIESDSGRIPTALKIALDALEEPTA